MTEPAVTADPPPTQQETNQSPPEAAPTVGPSGGGQLFANISRSLTDADLANPAVAKLILDRLHTAEGQRDDYRQYMANYYAADKNAGVLQEKLNSCNALLNEKTKTNIMVEVFYGTGIAIGCAAGGFAPYFWDKQLPRAGDICFALGAVLVIVAVVTRMLGFRK